MYMGPVTMTVGELSLDMLRRRAFIRGSMLPLAPKEWEFIEALALCYGGVVSREYLLVCLNPADAKTPGIRSIDTVACKVRKHIASLLGVNYVHRVWGVGYALHPPRSH